MNESTIFRRGLRVIVAVVRLSPVTFAVAVAGAAVFAAGTVASTIVLGRITDRVVLPAFEAGQVTSSSMWWAVVAVAAVTVVRSVGVVARRYYAGMTAERAQMRLREGILDQYLALPLRWHRTQPAGRLLAHADNDVEVTTNVVHPLPFSLGAGFLAVFSAIALLLVDPLIAVVAFAIFPTLTFINRIYSGLVEKPAAEVQEGVGAVSTIAHESFDGALVVKALGRAEAEIDRFTGAARHLQGRRRRVGYLRAVFESALDSLPNLGMVLVVAVGAWRIEAGAMSQGDLVQVAALFSVLAMPMRVFGFFLETLPPATVAHARIAGVMAEPVPEAPAPHQPRSRVLPDGPLGVEARSLGFAYGDGAAVLRGIDLRVEPGEVVALVGSTGTGKTTLCTLLPGSSRRARATCSSAACRWERSTPTSGPTPWPTCFRRRSCSPTRSGPTSSWARRRTISSCNGR